MAKNGLSVKTGARKTKLRLKTYKHIRMYCKFDFSFRHMEIFQKKVNNRCTLTPYLEINFYAEMYAMLSLIL